MKSTFAKAKDGRKTRASDPIRAPRGSTGGRSSFRNRTAISGGNRAETAIWALLALMLAALPFVVSPGGFEKFRLPKDVIFSIGAALIVGIFFAVNGFRRFCKWRSWEALLVVSIGYLLVHGLLVNPEITGWSASWIIAALLFLLVIGRAVPAARHPGLWLVAASATAVNAGLAILQFYGRFPLLAKNTGETLQGRLTPAGFIGDVNNGGFVFGLSALMLLYPLATRERAGLRVYSGLLLVMNLAGLAITQTLSATIAFVGAFVLWLVLHAWWLVRTQENRRKAYGQVAGLAGLVVVVVVLVVLFTGLGDRILLAAAALRDGDATGLTAGRYPVYLITWRMIKDAPVLGHGLASFGVDFFRYRTETELSRLEMIDQPGSFREAHNDYLQIWHELGGVGLLLFLLVLVLPCATALRGALHSKEPKRLYWTCMLVLGLVYSAITALGSFPFRLSLTALFIMLVLAGLRSAASDAEAASSGPAARGWQWRLAGAILAIVVVSYFGVQRWRANVQMGIAAVVLEEAYSSSLSARSKRIYGETALTRLRQAESMSPRLYDNYNLQGSANMLMGYHEAAAQQYERAARYIPSPEILTNQAVALVASGDKGQARELLKRALAYNPNYAPARRASELLEKDE